MISPSLTSSAREHALALARKHGWNATSFQTLREGFSYFFHSGGYVAYFDTGRAWVAAGAPICSPDALQQTTEAFVSAARSAGRRVVFFAVEPRLLEENAELLSSFPIGKQPIWDPSTWPLTLKAHRSLREQLRRARAKGVTIAQETDLAPYSSQIRTLVERWLATRSMPKMGFLVAVDDLLESPEAVHFVAFRAERIVGMGAAIPVPGRKGLFVEHLIRDVDAPNGTIELLIDTIFSWARQHELAWVTLGLAPLVGPVPKPLALARQRLRWLYDFEGLAYFKAKLRPDHWAPLYLAFPRSQGPVVSVIDALRAFAAGSFLSFFARLLSRGHPLMLRALALLLVPWTLLLASASAETWFHGHVSVKWAWVAFDTLILVALFRLARAPRLRLARALAYAVSLDALLTPLEAALWNLRAPRSPIELLIILVACLAPPFAAFVLFGTADRLRTLEYRPS
jgi:phosphatidylglycerol lysyltransferase